MAWYSEWRKRATAAGGSLRRTVRAAWTRAASWFSFGSASPPPPPGISVGRVASPRRAETDLQGMARSPNVYAGVTARALSLACYPIRVYRGYGAGADLEVLDPERVPWAGQLMRLLQLPDNADAFSLFPANPGEGFLSQIIADLIMTGNAFAAPTTSPSGLVVGLTRLHPRSMTLIRTGSGEEWEYRPAIGYPRRYARRDVAHMRLLSWSSGGESEIGVGAGTPLEHLVDAEATALQQTANVVRQGGVDVLVTAKTPAAAGYLQSEDNRKEVAQQVSTSMAAEDGRRVMVLGGDLEVKDSGLKPADVRAPELLTAARQAELAAIGVVPIAVGSEGGTYATAVQQYRVQAVNDESIVNVIEAGLLRPLARHFAQRAGGRWSMRGDQVTCRIDLSSHPGYAFIRSEAINRMKGLVGMGWSAEQAARAEGLELPPPEGKPAAGAEPGAGAGAAAGAADPAADPAASAPADAPIPSAAPDAPVGDAAPQRAAPAAPVRRLEDLSLDDLFRRAPTAEA